MLVIWHLPGAFSANCNLLYVFQRFGVMGTPPFVGLSDLGSWVVMGPGPMGPRSRSHGPKVPVPWAQARAQGPSDLVIKRPYTLFVESYTTLLMLYVIFKKKSML